MGTKKEAKERVEGILGNQLPKDKTAETLLFDVQCGLSKMSVKELDSLIEVLICIHEDYEKNLESARRHGIPESVDPRIKKLDIPTLVHSYQGGEVQDQIAMLGGIAKHLSDTWDQGQIGHSKRLVECIDRITSNIKGVIKAQLYDGLRGFDD